jgi:hypothetical protein
VVREDRDDALAAPGSVLGRGVKETGSLLPRGIDRGGSLLVGEFAEHVRKRGNTETQRPADQSVMTPVKRLAWCRASRTSPRAHLLDGPPGSPAFASARCLVDSPVTQRCYRGSGGRARLSALAVGQDTVNLATGADGELGEDFVEVVFDRPGAHEQLSSDFLV